MYVSVYDEEKLLREIKKNRAYRLTILYDTPQFPSLKNMSKLAEIDADDVGLHRLPEFPDNITLITADVNKIKSIDNLPEKLEELWLRQNFVSCISFPLNELKNLKRIYIDFNKIRTISEVPKKLIQFGIDSCGLTSIPYLTGNIRYIRLNDNLLRSVPEKIKTINSKWVFDNPFPKWLKYSQLIL